MIGNKKIVIKAMCLFYQDEKILVSSGLDRVTNKRFYRLLGGTVNFFETGEAGVRREIREELLSEIENLSLIDVVENLFTFEGIQGHQIVFLYIGDLSRKELYSQNPIRIVEETHEFDAEWIPISDILELKIPLYPSLDWKQVSPEWVHNLNATDSLSGIHILGPDYRAFG